MRCLRRQETKQMLKAYAEWNGRKQVGYTVTVHAFADDT